MDGSSTWSDKCHGSAGYISAGVAANIIAILYIMSLNGNTATTHQLSQAQPKQLLRHLSSGRPHASKELPIHRTPAKNLQLNVGATSAALAIQAAAPLSSYASDIITTSTVGPSVLGRAAELLQGHPMAGGLLLVGMASTIYHLVARQFSSKRATGNLRQEAAKLITACAGSAALLMGNPVDILDSNQTVAFAADDVAIGECVLARCQTQLAGCLADPRCVENLVCIKQCSGRPDETACQIRCGDLYDSAAVQRFDTCAVSDQKCVPKKVDTDAYPLPPDDALVSEFNTNEFNGRWYITAGENPIFDQFPCQEHFFTPDGPGKFYGKINWRVVKSDGLFLTRSSIQSFVQDRQQPGLLLNRDNEYLHYEDDWYVISAEPDEYVLVYYRGRNDAWVGYGGCVLYTRADSVTPELESKYRSRWEEAVKKVGLDWSKFKYTDNTCGPQPEGVVDLDVILDTGAEITKGLGTKILTIEETVQKRAAEAEKNLQFFREAIRDEFDTLKDQERSVDYLWRKTLSLADRWRESKYEAERQAATARLNVLERKLTKVEDTGNE